MDWTASDASSTVCAEARVWIAAPATLPSAVAMTSLPCAAVVTFREIWPVAAFCWSTEAATADVLRLISCMRAVMRWMASTEPLVEACTAWMPAVERENVGRLAERIVANELEWRGFRVSDLNRDGLSPNADLIAARQGKVWQIQVKGASNSNKERWWFQYGYCTAAIIENHEKMFNRKDSFYEADVVVLVAVRSPSEYRC